MWFEDRKYGDAWDKRYYKDFVNYYETHNYDGSTRVSSGAVVLSAKQRSVAPRRTSPIVLLLARVRWNELS